MSSRTKPPGPTPTLDKLEALRVRKQLPLPQHDLFMGLVKRAYSPVWGGCVSEKTDIIGWMPDEVLALLPETQKRREALKARKAGLAGGYENEAAAIWKSLGNEETEGEGDEEPDVIPKDEGYYTGASRGVSPDRKEVTKANASITVKQSIPRETTSLSSTSGSNDKTTWRIMTEEDTGYDADTEPEPEETILENAEHDNSKQSASRDQDHESMELTETTRDEVGEITFELSRPDEPGTQEPDIQEPEEEYQESTPLANNPGAEAVPQHCVVTARLGKTGYVPEQVDTIETRLAEEKLVEEERLLREQEAAGKRSKDPARNIANVARNERLMGPVSI